MQASVPEMFTRQAAKSPEATAVRDAEREVDYAELEIRSARLARSLGVQGIGRGHLVAVMLGRSPDLVVALLAVLRAGAAYVPISPDDPAERVGVLLQDARPSLVITSVRHAKDISALRSSRVLVVDEECGQAPDHTSATAGYADELPCSLSDSDAAYVIYTSGSTGRPKGVVVEHGALSSYLEYVTVNYPGVAGRTLLHSSVSFDMAVTSLYGPLVTGGTVDLVDLRTAGAAPAQGARVGGLSFLKVTPSHLPLLRALPAWCSPTDHLVIGGEALTTAELDRWWAEHPAVTVINEYGPTEATVGCSAYQVRRAEVADSTHVPIGRSTSGARLHVLDERLEPVPAGVTGELHISGEQLARGYLGRPGATAASFVADPFGPPGGRMYRSGDLVRERPDGHLEFLGRADDQMKINGYRVEPGEIQTVLTSHPFVAEAFVTSRIRGSAPQRLTAYVVPADGTVPDLRELRRFAAARLPEHMVPHDLVPLPALPLTANGKVDRDALPEAAPRDDGCAGGGAATAATAQEALLRGLAVELTGVPGMSVDDDFFRLGGSSIAAAKLVTRARRAGIELTLEAVLKGRTVRRMLAWCGGVRDTR